MKRNLILRNASVALALLTMVSVSSCRDQNFDWDEARATEQYQKFTNVFVKEFGKPAEGHQWGFDLANISMGGDVEVKTRGIYKIDMHLPGQSQQIQYTMPLPQIISKKEHDEVSAWFRHHKVRWAENPSFISVKDDNGNVIAAKGYNTRSTINNDNIAYFDLNGQQLPDGYNTIKELKDNNHSAYQDFLRNTLGFGSLVDHTDRNVLGNYRMISDVSYANVWVQHVSSDDSSDELAKNGDVIKANEKMNLMRCGFQNADNKDELSYIHLNDWNGGQGAGYDNSANNGAQTRGSATLITDLVGQNWLYHNSLDNRYHDKFFIAYLKGDDYEGYYLGFDFEANTDQIANKNQIVPANGISNDWIIKISSVGSVTNYNPVRIMCEDLGGNAKITGSDIDYNDVVIDVEYENNSYDNGGVLTLTLQAAGGTLPACVSYDDIPLFEVHELFNDVYGEHLTKDEYKIMYNTKGEKSPSGGIMAERPAKTFKLFINTNNGYTGARNEKYITDSGKFSIDRLKIKVYRNGVDDYLNQSVNTFNEAEWINLSNREGEAPLKICVPKYYNGEEVMWPQEKVKITLGYENFSAWVADPTKSFWDKNVYSVKPEYLYGSKFSGVTEDEKNPNEGQESEDFTEPVQPSEPEQPEEPVQPSEPDTPTDPDTPGTDEDADEIVLWEGNQEFTNWLWTAMKETIPILQANSPTASSKILYYIIINNPSDWAFNVTGVSIGPWNSPSDISVVEGDFNEDMLYIYGNGIWVQGNNITLTKITLKK